MSTVSINHPEACLADATGRGREGGNYFLNAIQRQRLRHRIIIGKKDGARSHDVFPTAFLFGNRSRPFPRPVRDGLASRVCQLHPGGTALFMNET